jgi:hypothetical protein
LGEKLLAIGLKPALVRELMTVNVPKILGGSLALVCSGSDVLLAFSDAIPHTFLAAGAHFAFGVLDLVFGVYPPNILMLTAGIGEIGVGSITAYRAWVDPVISMLGAPASVFLPALGHSIALSAVVASCAWLFSGDSFGKLPKLVVPSALAASAGTTTAFMLKAAHLSGFLSPFIGPLAGITAFVLARKALEFGRPSNIGISYKAAESAPGLTSFHEETAIPLLSLPKKPIGRIEGHSLIFDRDSVSATAAALA